MDKIKIEREAVFTVSTYVNRCPGLVPYIFYNDKTPMWDGNIFIYNSDLINNNNYYGIVSVQVKGTHVDDLTTDKISYNGLVKDHLRAYQNEGGVLLFVVQIKDNFENRIFYKKLDVNDIKKLLDGGANQPAIELNAIHDDKSVFYQEVKNFYKSRLDGIKSLLNYYSIIAEENPEIVRTEINYFNDVKATLNCLNNISREGKNVKEAEKILNKTLENFNKLASYHNYPEYQIIKAKILNDLAGIHMKFDRMEISEQEINEAIEIFKELVNYDSDAYTENYALSLANKAEILHNMGNRKNDAIKIVKESLELLNKRKNKITKYEVYTQRLLDIIVSHSNPPA